MTDTSTPGPSERMVQEAAWILEKLAADYPEAPFALDVERTRLLAAHLYSLAAPTPQSAPAQADDEWANIPPEIVQIVNVLGRAEWKATLPGTAEEHGAQTAQSVRITAEHFGLGDEPRVMQWLSIEGTDTVLAYIGTSPHSPDIARALGGAWNLLWEHCQAAAQAEAES